MLFFRFFLGVSPINVLFAVLSSKSSYFFDTNTLDDYIFFQKISNFKDKKQFLGMFPHYKHSFSLCVQANLTDYCTVRTPLRTFFNDNRNNLGQKMMGCVFIFLPFFGSQTRISTLMSG